MTPSEARARESREWFTKADEDLASERVLIGSGHIMFGIAGAIFTEIQSRRRRTRG
jgi:hypothetical protein